MIVTFLCSSYNAVASSSPPKLSDTKSMPREWYFLQFWTSSKADHSASSGLLFTTHVYLPHSGLTLYQALRVAFAYRNIS